MISAIRLVARIRIVTVLADVRVFVIVNVDMTRDQVNQLVDPIAKSVSEQVVKTGKRSLVDDVKRKVSVAELFEEGNRSLGSFLVRETVRSDIIDVLVQVWSSQKC